MNYPAVPDSRFAGNISRSQPLESIEIIIGIAEEDMKGKHRMYKHSHFSSRGGRIVARVLSQAILKIPGNENMNH